MTQNDVMQLFIGKNVDATGTTTAGNAIYEASDTYLLDGEMAVCNSHNIVLDTGTVLSDDLVKKYGIKIIQRSGTKLIESDLIHEDNILNYQGQVDVAFAEQLWYIGYNGTANSIEVNNSTLYVIRLLLKEQSLTGFGQEIILNSAFKSDAAATEAEIADGLALILSKTLRRQAVPPIKSELLNEEPIDNATCFANAVTVVNGESTFLCTTNVNHTTNVPLVAGDYVRLGSPGVAPTLVSGVYKVTAINTLIVTVDRPIEATSGTYAVATFDAQVIVADDATAESFGIKLTGIARTFGMPKNRYSKVSFDVGLDDGFGDTVSAIDTRMSLGHGYYAEIAELEHDLLGNDGNPYNADFLWTAHKSDAAASGYYDVLGMTYYSDHSTQGVGTTPRRNKQLQLAFERGYTAGSAPDCVIDILDAYTTMTSGLTGA